MVEHSPYDKFWGDGHSDGLNWLGKLLEEIRESYIKDDPSSINKENTKKLLGKRPKNDEK